MDYKKSIKPLTLLIKNQIQIEELLYKASDKYYNEEKVFSDKSLIS